MSDAPSGNPYAAPATFSPEKASFAGFEVRGKKLAVQDGAVLPARCIKTNQDVTVGENGRMKRIKFAWSNPWLALLIFVPYAGLLIYIIVALSTRKSGTITVSLSHQTIKRKRIWLITLLLLAIGIPALVFGLEVESIEVLVISIIASILFLLTALFTTRYLTPVNHKNGWFLIRGINRDYLNDLASRKI